METASSLSGRDNINALLWALASAVVASAMTVSVRPVAEETSPIMTVMLRAGFSAGIILLVVALLPPIRRQLRFTRPRDHLLRGTLIAVATALGFWTIAEVPLATAAVLFFTAPIFAVIIAALFQGERVGPRRWLAVLIGFAGALVILRPGLEAFHPAMLGALGSSLLFATALSMSRKLAQADGPLSAFVSSVFVTMIIMAPIALPRCSLPDTEVGWIATGILVITGAVRNVADIQSYRYGDAAVVGPVSYLRIVFVGLAGWLLFAEVPDLATIIGAAIIIGSTLYIARREARLGRAGRPAAP
ncbi:MAG: DMT family transporter [Rubricella sp.]